MRVLFVITELNPGGAEGALVQIASHLAASGETVAVASLAAGGVLAAALRDAGVEVLELGWSGPRSLWRLPLLRQTIRRWQPDIVQTFLFHANVATRIALAGSGVPVVAGHRVAEREHGWHLTWERRTATLAMHHVAVSEGVAARLGEAGVCRRADLTVIPNGVDRDRFAVATPDRSAWDWEGRPFDGVRLLAVGRLHPQKGFDLLIPAVTQAAAVDPDTPVRLVVAGDGPERSSLQRLIASDGSPARLLGHVDQTAPLLAACDLFVLSSRWEGMPNALLEAAAAGCRLLTTPVEGVDAIATAGETVETVSTDALAAGLRRELSTIESRSPQLPDRTLLTWPEVAERYRELFAAIVAGQRERSDRDGSANFAGSR